jgi:cytoskeletal protein CcmA (bactofilin family)
VSFETLVRIDGVLKGELFSSCKVIIGPDGVLDASAVVESLVVKGKVKGKIKSSGLVEILAGAEVEADLTTPALSINEGAFYSGRCAMPDDKILELKAETK